MLSSFPLLRAEVREKGNDMDGNALQQEDIHTHCVSVIFGLRELNEADTHEALAHYASCDRCMEITEDVLSVLEAFTPRSN